MVTARSSLIPAILNKPMFLVILFIISACQPRAEKKPTPILKDTSSYSSPSNTPTLEKPAYPSPVATLTLSYPATPLSSTSADITVNFANRVGKSPSEFGVNGWWSDEDAELWHDRYAELSPRIVRVPVIQQVLEPTNDDEDPTHYEAANFYFDTPIPAGDDRHLTYRRWFESLRDQNVTLLVYVPYLSDWLSYSSSRKTVGSPFPPNNLDEYAEFIRVLLTYLVEDIHYPPQQIILEPVNEPDLACGADLDVPCFWENWQVEDLVAVLKAAYTQAHGVHTDIRLAGPALCCHPELLTRLMDEYNAAAYLDILTYHAYDSENFNLNPFFQTAEIFSRYNLPVYLDEYGNKIHLSNGENGALWHAITLSELWKAGITPIQFSISEWPSMHAGYNQMGLFKYWSDNWELKPSYWVYVNFFTHMRDLYLVSTTLPDGIFGVAGVKPDEKTLSIWLTNVNFEKNEDVKIGVNNWPYKNARVEVFNNLVNNVPVQTFNIQADSADSLIVNYPVQPKQSWLFVISPSQ
jgi:hypothetical protein